MKTLFENPSKLVKFSLTFVAFFVALGIIFAAVFGFHTSTEYNGYYEISIDSFDAEQEEKIDNKVKEILSKYKYTVEEKVVEDRDYCKTLVYRYESNSTQNAEEIKNVLKQDLALNEGMITVEKLTNAQNGITIWNYLITFVAILIVSFLAMVIYGGVKSALTVVSAESITGLLSMAIIAFTRITLSKGLIILSLVASVISGIVLLSIIGKIKQQKDNNTALSYKDSYLTSLASASVLEKIILAVCIFIVPCALIFTFNTILIMFGLGYIVCALVALFTTTILSPAIYVALEDKQEERTKQIVSRNTKNKK